MAIQSTILQEVQMEKAYRFTVEEYKKILETGIFDDERVELLNGVITDMESVSQAHFGMIIFLNRLLVFHCMDKYCCSPQSPIKFGDYGAPMPDFAIAKFRKDRYMGASMKPEDILFIIEVADSSLKRDRKVKAPIYAASNVPEYWIVNLQDYQIEVFKQPRNTDYQVKTIAKAGETVTCEGIDFTVSVDEIFENLKKT